MRLSRYHLPTIKEAPAEAEIASHRLMIRAGMIRKLAAGVYSQLPLMVRTIRKVETVIRQEMEAAGAMEVFLPSVQPAELWRESGRWDFYGKELLRLTDRHGREFCYGPTAEEVVTDLVRRDVKSYRDLPVNLFQIQTKFRDEIRPRFGVMRSREFSMKDAYSFDADAAGADATYEAMRGAYHAIFRRLGLTFRAVEADTGQIGGSASHEFMVLASSGEDLIAFCDACDYAANVEKVELTAGAAADGGAAPLTKVATPGKKSVDEVSAFLGTDPAVAIKTMIYVADGERVIAALVRGDREVNEVKLARAVGAVEVTLADDATVTTKAGTVVGYAGPVGLTIDLIADNEVAGIGNGVTGANEVDAHYTGVRPGRDFVPTACADIRNPVVGDACPRCEGGKLDLARGIEVGHIFKLGTKYSESLKATFLDADGKERPMIMGCYGIGVARSAAAAIEQNHDDAGIVWPPAIAPFDVAVLPLGPEAELMEAAEKIYADLLAAGFDPALDDRDARAGVKFADADLVGYPVQVVLGKKGLKEGKAEIKIRKSGERSTVPLDETVAAVRAIVESLSA